MEYQADETDGYSEASQRRARGRQKDQTRTDTNGAATGWETRNERGIVTKRE